MQPKAMPICYAMPCLTVSPVHVKNLVHLHDIVHLYMYMHVHSHHFYIGGIEIPLRLALHNVYTVAKYTILLTFLVLTNFLKADSAIKRMIYSTCTCRYYTVHVYVHAVENQLNKN